MQSVQYKKILITTLLFLSAAVIPALAVAEMSSTNYRISPTVLSGGGGTMSSASFQAIITLGQPTPVVDCSSSSYGLYTGFWNIVTKLVATGDINDDGTLDLTDVILGLQVMVGAEPDDIHRGADANDDGVIGIADVIYVLQKVSE